MQMRCFEYEDICESVFSYAFSNVKFVLYESFYVREYFLMRVFFNFLKAYPSYISRTVIQR